MYSNGQVYVRRGSPDSVVELRSLIRGYYMLYRYRFSHILKALRALSSSTKTSLRIDEDGLLSLQFLMPSPKAREGTDAFIEFRVCGFLNLIAERVLF